MQYLNVPKLYGKQGTARLMSGEPVQCMEGIRDGSKGYRAMHPVAVPGGI